MELNELKELITEYTDEDVIVFDNPSYTTAFIGLSNDNRAVYDYDRMLEYLVEQDDMSYEDAADFISYNTERALDYMSDGNKPIIVYNIE